MASTATHYPEAVQFLDALLQGVPDDQLLEIRTFKKSGGAKKRFYSLSRLRQEGLQAALPAYLDGKTNVYYGVCPRYESRQATSASDRGDAVNLATTLWLDEITKPAPDQPPFSWMLETSVGKVQAGYFLTEPTNNLDRVEALNQRLGAAVGGDNVWNRGRILRLPGFINLNHPGEQRARLLEFHPDRRYTLDELDQLLPQPSQDTSVGGRAWSGGSQRAGSFNPHWPYPLPEFLQDRLVGFLQGLGLQRYPDGRFSGACPFPHRDGLACDCDRAFYASPISGSWCCFCSDHQGQASGTVRDFGPLGLVTDLGWEQIQVHLGKFHLGPGEFINREGRPSRSRKPLTKQAVANKVKRRKDSYRKSDRPRGKRALLWQEARSLFPIPSHIKPWVKGGLLWSERNGQGIAVDLFSNSWRNPANAQFKRQKLYFNLLPRINGAQLYQRLVPIDDWSERLHKRIARQIQRAKSKGQGWLWFDNALKRGYFLYLTSVPGLREFKPVGDVQPILIDALKCIIPPGRGEDESRFRAYGGSRNWVSKAEETGEEDQDRWEMIAVSPNPTDFAGVEVECVVAGVSTEYRRPYWRGQPQHGLIIRYPTREDFIDFALELPGQYVLTKSAQGEMRTGVS